MTTSTSCSWSTTTTIQSAHTPWGAGGVLGTHAPEGFEEVTEGSMEESIHHVEGTG